ncbi:MAG: NFACT family protein [Oscillospiraceae bacterium]|nr:NFACT family protein [Oscillospiraceae bacterium]
MPLDGVTLHFLRGEILHAVGARAEKIHQPEKHSLVITLKSRDFSGRLLLCSRPDAPRAHFTASAPENPAAPPMFCMFLRKRLGSARLIDVRQEGLDRVLYLDFAATDDLGDPAALTLCAELIPGRANLILTENGKILDAIRRVYPEMDSQGKAASAVMPGATYLAPHRPAKLNLLIDEVPKNLADEPLGNIAEGVSPLLARELCGDDAPSCGAVTLQKLLQSAQCAPTLLRDCDGTPREFSCVNIRQYGDLYTAENYTNLSTLLDAFYSERESRERLRRTDGGLRQCLETLLARTRRRVESQRTDLARAGERDMLRRYGDLILAQQYKLRAGSAFYDADDYENPGETVRIPADPRLSPTANAQNYYKRYQKARSAQENLHGQIARGETDADYLENALDALDRARTAEEIAALRGELAAEGFLAADKPRQKQQHKSAKLPKPMPILQYALDNYQILVGRTAAQNERITFREAKRGDLWLHAQKVPGAHVLIRAEGREIPPEVIEQAAALAAYHSAARAGGKVAVDITAAKKLKKPVGGRPGMAIYHEYETIMVAPREL